MVAVGVGDNVNHWLHQPHGNQLPPGTWEAGYLRANKLGAIMVWELSGDDPKAELWAALHAGLMGKTSPQ